MSGSRERMARNQPQSLLECAAHVVGTIITEKVVDMFDKYMNTDMFQKYISVKQREELESHITGTIECFDEIIPKPLHNIITKHSLRLLPHDFFWKLKCDKNELNFFDIILRSHTTTFDITSFDEIRSAQCKSLKRLKNLQYLQLEPVKNENLNHITEAIKDMKKLDSIKCCGCCDEIVEVLCKNCPLRELNFYNCMRVTDISVPYILKLQSLEKLYILSCGFSKKSIYEILSGLPNLKTIRSDHLQDFLAQINEDSVVLPFKCVEYFCDTEVGIINLTKYCPLITELDISLIRNHPDDLSGLATLSHLKSLKIHLFLLEVSHIKSLLELIGHQLIELELKWFKNISTETENKIRSLCPNLKSLDLEKMYQAQYSFRR